MTKSPHFWWIICVLSAIIIGLVAYIITERILCSEDLMEYVSVCSIVLSITLSIFAIQYTYYSNNQVDQQFRNINSVADNIKDTAKSLAETNTILNHNMGKILDRLDNIDSAQEMLKAQLKDINNNKVSSTGINNFDSSPTQQG